MHSLIVIMTLGLSPAQPISPAVAAARQRQDALASVEFVYSTRSVRDTHHLHALLADHGEPLTPPPNEPIRSESTGNRLMFAGGRMKWENNQPIYNLNLGREVGQRHVWAFTGNAVKVYNHPPEKVTAGHGFFTDAREATLPAEPLWPFTFAVRGLDEVLCPYPVNELVPAGTATVRGRVCEQFRVKKQMGTAEQIVSLDPAAGYTLRRYRTSRPDGSTITQIDVESSNANHAGVWLPKFVAWQRFDKAGKPTSTQEFTVERVEVGKAYSDAEFDFPWPAGLRVEDQKTMVEYVADSNGSLWQRQWPGGPPSVWLTRQWWAFALGLAGWVIYRRVRKRQARKAAAAATRPGVTLIELLVVLAIIAILAGLLLAAVQKVRLASARVVCLSRMQQVGIALHNHHAAKGEFPAGVWFTPNVPLERSVGLSWQTALLPYLEQDALWQRAWAVHQVDPNGTTAEHRAVATVKLPVYRCFADTRDYGRYQFGQFETIGDPGWALNNYLGVAGTGMNENDGMLHPDKATKLVEVTDGTSHTVMVGERPSGPNGFHSNWYAGWGGMHFYHSTLMPVNRRYANHPVMHVACPRVSVYQAGRYDDPCHDYHFWSLHDGGANFLFVDGGTRFLPYSAVEVLPALATKAGGEVAGEW